MDALYIEKVSEELNQLFKKKKITGYAKENNSFSVETGNEQITFVLKNPNGIILKKEKIQDKTYLKKFRNLFIKSVSTLNKDRVIIFNLIKISVSGKTEEFNLIIELTGKHSNVIITDSSKKILYTFKEVESTVRNIKIGEEYILPPNEKKEFKEIKFGEVTPQGIEKKLYRFIKGLSPLNCKEIAFYVKNGLSLEEAYQKFITNHKNSNIAFLYFENKKPKFLTTFKYESLKDFKYIEFKDSPSFISAWQYFTEQFHIEMQIDTLKSKLVKLIERKLKTIDEKLSKMENPDNLLQKAKILKKAGELLKYNLHKIKPGVNKLTLTDYETEDDLTITVNPAKTPQQNLNDIFKKAKKLENKAVFEKTEREKLLSQRKFLEALKEKVFSLNSIQELQEIEKLLTTQREKSKEKEKNFPYKITLPSGKQLLIGRNRVENEIISLKLSNPWDIWFHAKETPGSHVLLKLDKGESPSEADIKFAASAAAFFSKGKNSGKIKIDYTPAKYLKKPPGTPSGYVIYKNEKTVVIDSSEFEKFLKNNNLLRK
ncbi:NFACT RNA binding domain-containing protein [Desulfurobacterium atlanticum]|uniref:Predicted component of the ribosome quality control (RQC) complex, YloA/Tae2 family, contains fibronectin-binding (FbpA) and DUF814 domains n=1 Tax=Desulfurobacterium atlanticum TaxID=240169 RepID=A0A238Z5S0_9BACT|nr:NFACT RNA binding domain-containing protein [Desulfurobacterium atlanticum]SNR78532.1 Predicted component of the ribosome quality control (RQC) complex, YloA/Tae2 family, contains fibronectin-binding (FbpA) and DUF814 domains [Desulfurobacterium atlanticum]